MLVLSDTKKKEILDDLEKRFLDVGWSEVETPIGILLRSQEVCIFSDSGRDIIKMEINPKGSESGKRLNLIFRLEDPFLQRAKNLFFKIQGKILKDQLEALAFKMRCLKSSC